MTGPLPPMTIHAIGVVHSDRTDPGYSDGWGQTLSRIDLFDELGPDALTGLAGFSHVEVLWWFHQAARRDSYTGVKPARGRDDLPPIGVFAARGPHRPNPIAVSACELLELGATWLRVRGLDAVDGTPVLDLKPVMPRLIPHHVSEPDWSAELMRHYYDDPSVGEANQ